MNTLWQQVAQSIRMETFARSIQTNAQIFQFGAVNHAVFRAHLLLREERWHDTDQVRQGCQAKAIRLIRHHAGDYDTE
jgi:hypothetical protein